MFPEIHAVCIKKSVCVNVLNCNQVDGSFIHIKWVAIAIGITIGGYNI